MNLYALKYIFLFITLFEIYFPIYSNNGWELSQTAYAQKIRFSLSADMRSIYNFFRRGFL